MLTDVIEKIREENMLMQDLKVVEQKFISLLKRSTNGCKVM
jgi:hypothetical protein